MSRHPLILYPAATDLTACEFEVRSTEWSWDGSERVLSHIVRDLGTRSCTFSPSELWLSEGFFPAREWPMTHESIAQFLAAPQRSPRSLYTHRLAQTLERLLAAMPANSGFKQTPDGAA